MYVYQDIDSKFCLWGSCVIITRQVVILPTLACAKSMFCRNAENVITNKQILKTETLIWRAQSIPSSKSTFSHFPSKTEHLRAFILLPFLQIQLILCIIIILSATIASRFFPMASAIVFYIIFIKFNKQITEKNYCL